MCILCVKFMHNIHFSSKTYILFEINVNFQLNIGLYYVIT